MALITRYDWPGKDLGGDLREFRDRQLVAVGEHHGAKQRVLELAHVASR
jgi:hypothetical protein